MIFILSPDLTRDVIIPFKYRQIYGEEITIRTAPELYSLACEIEKTDDPFSDAALRLVWQKSAAYLDSIGYADYPFRTRRDLIFTKTAPTEKKRENSVKITSDDGYENLTTVDFSGLDCFATVTDGKIVSLAAAYKVEDGALEICAETVPGSRGRGYATSNVCALSDLLVSRGETVRYLCAETNKSRAARLLARGLCRQGRATPTR